MNRQRFEQLVRDAIDAVPEPFVRELARVPVLVQDEPPPGESGLYGLYHGVALDERFGSEPLEPSTITIYMRTLLDHCEDEIELEREVRITLLHELGHHLGLDEDDLDRLGYA